jgi:hypothetical protein
MFKNFTLTGGIVSLYLILTPSQRISGQSVTATPQNLVRPIPPATVTVSLKQVPGGWGDSGDYVWTVSPSNGVIIGSYNASSLTADVTVTFTAAASGAYVFQLSRGSHVASTTINVGNIAACSSNGYAVSAFNVLNGNYSSGPGTIFSPVVQTAALGISTSGYFYYMPRNYYGNHGNVTIYAARPDGSSSTAIASIDLNGPSNNDLGFVRMAIDPIGNGWLLAGDNSTLYLAKFPTNGINPTSITVVDPSVTLVNGSVSSFFNGDICFSGTGTLYALANVTNGVTQVFTGTPNGSSTTLTKKWDLVNENGNNFNGSVNGVAFDALGSLYISTSTGLYFINQGTVNSVAGTVQCTLVKAMSGLTDLGSNLFPQQSALPLRLASFSASYANQKALLTWDTESETNVDHFEIERSNGSDFVNIASVQAVAVNGTKQRYQFTDDLSTVYTISLNYRLKMIDLDGQFKYSPVVLIRKDNNQPSTLMIVPNPVTNHSASLRLHVEDAGTTTFHVLDLSGKLLLKQSITAIPGVNSVAINGLERLAPGIYVLQWMDKSDMKTTKFIITQ